MFSETCKTPSSDWGTDNSARGDGGTPVLNQTSTHPTATTDDARRFAIDAARLAHENRTEDVAVLDLRGLSSLADYFVIGTGTSERQMIAVLDLLREHAKRIGRRPFNVSDTRTANWILADYVDVVVHLFDADHRSFYALDDLWGDAPRVAWSEQSVGRPAPH